MLKFCFNIRAIRIMSYAVDGLDQEQSTYTGDPVIDFAAFYYLHAAFIQKWMLQQLSAEKDTAGLAVIGSMRREAVEFAQDNDFETASILLDAAKELIGLYEETTPAEKVTLSEFGAKNAGMQWTRQIITGTDFWQFNDELAYQLDDTGNEASLNPFAGIRLSGEREFSQNNRFETMAQFKASNEYQDAEFYVKNKSGSNRGNQLIIENRFEGTRETRNFDSQYWGNTFSAQAKIQVNQKFAAIFGDDFRLRRYNGDDAFSDSYQQNRLFSMLEFNPTISTRAYARYDFSNRSHSSADSLDYREHRIDLTLFQLTAQNTSFFFENIWTRRNYFKNTNASSFFNSYKEENFLGDIRLGLSDLLALGLRADFVLRHYDEITPQANPDGALVVSNDAWTMPDYLNFSSNPRLLFSIMGDWQIGIGYLYNLRVYRDNIVDSQPHPVTDAAASDTATQAEVIFDDYYSHGISLSLELFRMDGLMVSLTNQYEERRYPNAPDISGRLFNHDTAINSILLFSSWTINPHFELSALINSDNENARTDEFSDIKNTFLSFDLAYSF